MNRLTKSYSRTVAHGVFGLSAPLECIMNITKENACHSINGKMTNLEVKETPLTFKAMSLQ